MKRSENNQVDQKEYLDEKFHGKFGSLSVSIRKPVTPGAVDFVQACKKIGFEIGDYNGENIERAGLCQLTVKNGARCSAADAFIWDNLHRPNLDVVCHALVHRVLFKRSSSGGPPVAFA